MKKKQIIKVLGVVVIIGAVAGTTAFAGNSGMKVTTQQVTQGNVVRSIEVEGHIETEQEKAYYAQVTAPVAEFELIHPYLNQEALLAQPVLNSTKK